MSPLICMYARADHLTNGRGANIATATCIKILETSPRLPLPAALVFASVSLPFPLYLRLIRRDRYAALDFNFTSWMSAANLQVLRSESSANIASILRDKDHLEHRSPLSVVADVVRPRVRRRRSSWGRTFVTGKPSAAEEEFGDDEAEFSDPFLPKAEQDKSMSERVVYWDATNAQNQVELANQVTAAGEKVLAKAVRKGPLETRLAMTSRTAFFSDRIISPPMVSLRSLVRSCTTDDSVTVSSDGAALRRTKKRSGSSLGLSHFANLRSLRPSRSVPSRLSLLR